MPVRLQSRVIIAALLLAALLFPRPASAISLTAGQPAPAFSLKDLDGKVVSLDSYRGKTLVIAFFSTWCSRCEEELSFLRDTFGARNDVSVVLVNQDGENPVMVEKIRDYRERLSISFPMVLDEGLILWDRYGINALPTSVVVGRDGMVRFVEPNFYWASPDRLLEAVGGDRAVPPRVHGVGSGDSTAG